MPRRALLTVTLTILLAAYCQGIRGGPDATQNGQTSRFQQSRERLYFIAAEEVSWNYAPSDRDQAMGSDFTSSERNIMEATPDRIGRVYEKAVYREYSDATFTKPVSRSPAVRYLGLSGPVIHAEVGDTIRVVFKNMGSRPYSIHAHGVLYLKDSEGSGYDDNTAGDDRLDDAVSPGSTHVYTWQVPERAGPGPNDPSSIAWVYHSHVDEMRDIASGLFGAIIVTAHGKARPDGTPADVDRELIMFMMSINENESWYFDENTRKLTIKRHLSTAIEMDPAFRSANIRHSINGYMFGNMPLVTMKQGEHVRWYLATLGDSMNFHAAHWHGNTVLDGGRRADVIALTPAETVTVDMVPDNPGIWLFHCHVSDHMAGGMTARYEVRP